MEKNIEVLIPKNNLRFSQRASRGKMGLRIKSTDIEKCHDRKKWRHGVIYNVGVHEGFDGDDIIVLSNEMRF